MTETCPTCKGTGRVWGLACYVCDGDGNVPNPQPSPKG